MENLSKIVNDGLQVKCNNPQCITNAEFVCEVCSDGYCSLYCQSLDWHRHKSMCQAMPLLVAVPENPILNAQFNNVQNILPNWHALFSAMVSAIPSMNTEVIQLIEILLATFKLNNREKNGEAAEFQVKSSPSIAAASLGPTSDVNVIIEGGESELQGKLTSLPTIGEKIEETEFSISIGASQIESEAQTQGKAPSITGVPTIGEKREEATISQGQSALKVAKPIAASPPRIFGKEAAQTQAAAIIGMPTIGEIFKEASFPPMIFGTEAAQTQGKRSSINAMPTIDRKNDESTQTQEMSLAKAVKPVSPLPPVFFGKEAKWSSVTVMPTIGEKHEEAIISQGQSPWKFAKSFDASPPRSFGKEAAQTLAEGPSIIGMPTIDQKREEVTISQGQSALKVAKPIAASPPRIFGKEASQTQAEAPLIIGMPTFGDKLKEASFPPMIFGTEAVQTQGKRSSINSMPTIDRKNEESTQTQEMSLAKAVKPVSPFPPVFFGKEAAQAQGKGSSITAMPTINGKIEGAAQTHEMLLSKADKTVSSFPPMLFGTKAAQTQGKGSSMTAMPTINGKIEGAVQTQEMSQSKRVKPVSSFPPMIFGTEAAHSQGKGSLITAMPTINGKNGRAAETQGMLLSKAAKPVFSFPPLVFGTKVAVTVMPTISEKLEEATTSQGQSPWKFAKPIAALSPSIFGKEAAQTLAEGPSVTLMPTMGEKLKEASFPPMIFGIEVAQTQGKRSSINAMPTIAGSNVEEAQTQGMSLSKTVKRVSSFPPMVFGRKAADLQGKEPLATTFNAEATGYLKSIISDKADGALTTIKSTPFDVAVKSIEEPLTTPEEWKTSYESEFFKFLPFRVQHVNNVNVLWISDVGYLPHLEALNVHMQNDVLKNLQPVPKESIADGMLLIALFPCKTLYRVKVIKNSLQQQNCLVQAIDSGNKSFINWNCLYKASAQAAGMKAFAFPVEIQGKTYDLIKSGSVIHLRLIKAAGVGELIKAEIQYDSVEEIMDLISSNIFEIKILKISDDGKSALVQYPNKLNGINEDLTKAIESADSKTFTITEKTYLVAAHTVEGWRRGVIIDSLPGKELHLIYLIDEGCLKVIGKLQYLPDKLAEISACVFAITAKGNTIDLKKYQINNRLSKYEILHESEKKVILYCDCMKICQVYVKSYFDNEEFCNKLAIKDINPNDSYVYITKWINHAVVYINLADSKQYPGLFHLLTPKCSEYMEEKPTVQDIVLVKPNGGDYYRGEIILLSSDNEDIYDVLNIDTGNLHKSVHMDTMLKPCNFILYLPRHLQELTLTMMQTIRCPTMKSSGAILLRLNEYIQEGTLFHVEYRRNSLSEGNLLFLNRNGIGLSEELLPLYNQHAKEKQQSSSPTTNSDVDQTSDHTLINDDDILANASDGHGDRKQKLILKNLQYNEEVFKLLPPSPPESPQPRIEMKLATKKNTFERFTLQDVQMKNMPTGRNIDIIMLDDSNIKTNGFVCCTYFENDAEIVEFHDNMDKVHAYGSQQRAQNDIHYKIGINEICVALLKEDERWYRALCLSHNDDDMITVMFLDFGYIQKVHKSEIMPITKGLLYSIYGNFCYIRDYKVNKPNPEVENYMLKNEKRLKCRQIIDAGEPGHFIVELDM